MRRGRSFKTSKEHTREQKLAYENKQLQREVTRLRKSLDRLKFGWCPNCTGEGIVEEGPKAMVRDRTCYSCGKANLIIIKYEKPEGIYYYRSCPVCGHRTKGKKLTEEVKE